LTDLDREKLILVAMLSGSDYTTGIEGVGPVTALEIIADSGFRGERTFDTLLKFYDWWTSAQETKELVDAENKLREKWRKLKIRPGFPSQAVYEAYTSPTLDTSTEPFRWGSPDPDALRHFAKNRFGWDQARADAILTPALRNFSSQDRESRRQSTLDSFITRLNPPIGTDSQLLPSQSKRLQRAMKSLRRQRSEEGRGAPAEVDLSTDDSDSNSAGPGKRKGKVGIGTAELKSKRKKVDGDSHQGQIQGGSKGHHIPKGTGSPIPQRLKTTAEREENKRKAIRVLKNGKGRGSVRE